MFEYPTVTLNVLCNSCAKIGRCSPELSFMSLYGASGIQKQASNVFHTPISLTQTSLFIQSHELKSQGVRYIDSKNSISVNIQN